VNDVLTAGAEPLFFWIIWRLVLNPEQLTQVVAGISQGVNWLGVPWEERRQKTFLPVG